MARGGLSNDPVKRKRQLDALRRGNQRAAARLDELESPADEPAATAEPAAVPAGGKPGSRRVDVGKVTLPKPGKRARGSQAKPDDGSQADKPVLPGKPASAPAKPRSDWAPPRGALELPFSRRRDNG